MKATVPKTVRVTGLGEQTKARNAYREAKRQRGLEVRENLSRRWTGQAPLPLTPLPPIPLAPFAFAKDGTYEGRLDTPEDCPPGCKVLWRQMA